MYTAAKHDQNKQRTLDIVATELTHKLYQDQKLPTAKNPHGKTTGQQLRVTMNQVLKHTCDAPTEYIRREEKHENTRDSNERLCEN